MNTVIVKSSHFNAHYPVDIPKNTVNAEAVLIRLDSEWDNLTVRIHWLNVESGVEKVVLLERDQPNTIPWEVLNDLGELRMGLVGMDGETTVKPTIWLTFGRVVEGPDADGGEDTKPPTPGWAQQMVEQATAAAEAAKAAQEAAEQAGPYAQAAQASADAAKASEVSAASSAQAAGQSQAETEQAKISALGYATAAQQAQDAAQQAVSSIGNAVDLAQSAATAAGSAQRAAETAQAGADQSAGTAQTAATTASQAAQTAQGAATQAGKYLSTVEADAQAAANAATAAGKSQEAAQSYDQEAKEAAEAAKASQDAAATSAQQANEAAQTAQEAVSSIGNAVDLAQSAATAAGSAQRAAETAQAGAAQSAQAAAGSASAAQTAKAAAEAAATILPTPTQEDAGKAPIVNSEGTGYVFGQAGGVEDVYEYIDTISVTEDGIASIEQDLPFPCKSILFTTHDLRSVDVASSENSYSAITATVVAPTFFLFGANDEPYHIWVSTQMLATESRVYSYEFRRSNGVWIGTITMQAFVGGQTLSGSPNHLSGVLFDGNGTSKMESIVKFRATASTFANGAKLYLFGVKA